MPSIVSSSLILKLFAKDALTIPRRIKDIENNAKIVDIGRKVLFFQF